MVEGRVAAQIQEWLARGLTLAEDELQLLQALSAREVELEAALRERPDERESHLIYGDWLQAQGDPRGQLIALHHALALAEERVDGHEAEQLRRRIATYEQDHAGHLFGPLRQVIASLDVQWRLGMIDGAFVGPLAWTRHCGGPLEVLASLLALPIAARMQRLSLGSALLDWPELVSVLVGSSVVAQLRELDLGDHVRPRRGRERLGRDYASLWPHMRKLRRLAIHGDRVPLRELHSSSLEHLELHLDGVAIASELLRGARLPRLRRLTLGFGGERAITGAGLAELLASTELDELLEVELRIASGVLERELAELLARIPKLATLVRLDLSRCIAAPRTIEALQLAQTRGRLPADLRWPTPI